MQPLKIFLLFLYAMLSSQSGAAAKTKSPHISAPTYHTVRDYYLLLPTADKDYTFGSPRQYLKPESLIAMDIPHDYIETAGDGAQPHLQTTVFRFHGTELFAVSAGFEDYRTLKFYRLRKGRLHDVTSQVWKIKLRPDDQAVLPRYGTTIVIRDRTHWDAPKKRFTVQWHDGRFIK